MSDAVAMREGEGALTILDRWLAPEEVPRLFEAMELAVQEMKRKPAAKVRSPARHFSFLCLREDPICV